MFPAIKPWPMTLLCGSGNSIVAGNSSQNENTFWFPMSSFYKKKSYWVTLLWSNSQCMYFLRPNTLLLCIFLFCIFLLYCTDPQVEVQIRILLKDKYVKLCQNANTSNHTLISWTVRFLEHRFKENFKLGFFIKEKQLASQFVFLVKFKHRVLANIWFIVCLGFF